MLKKSKTTVWTAQFHNGTFYSVVQELEDASRATRLVDDSTRFLIVKVNKKTDDTILRQCLSSWMRDGLVVSSTSYTFFGYSESHIKNGRLVFFREDSVWTVNRVHQHLGDLRSVFIQSGYGKYSARLGLSFSSTVESLDVPHEQALRLSDWRAPDGSLHSDGCGMIRDSFAARMCAAHELPPDTSVFQIRRGGIKGLLVRYPDQKFDQFCGIGVASRTPYLIAYRDSMLKYDGGPTVLELNDHSSCPGPARLNIQFIILLLCLKIPREVFENMVNDQLDIIGCIAHDREKAEKYVRGELDAADTGAFNQDLYALLLAKHDLQEPYVQQRLKQFQKLQYDSLRNKLNVRVEESCRVFGVIDEDGVLEEDEVFINLPGRTGVLVRDVLVCRNPCYSPGDLRKFRAVNYEELKHHKYCIVFSRKAGHSIPDTMSSGDLDGDEYFVTWDPALLPMEMSRPLERAPAQSANASGSSDTRNTRGRSDMTQAAIDTFVQQRFSSLLGAMVNAWTKAAEATPQLADGPIPRALVPLIESTHDIMKSGDDPAELQRKFRSLTGKARGGSRTYVSPIQKLRNMVPQQEPTRIDEFACDPALDLRDQDSALWEHFTAEARQVLRQYNRELSVAIKEDADDGDYDASSEREKRKEQKHAERVKRHYCDRYFGGGNLRDQYEQRFRASAWYCYGYGQGKQSFAWLGERCLNDIRAHWTNGGKPVLYVGTASIQQSSSSAWSASTCTLVGDSDPQVEVKAKADGAPTWANMCEVARPADVDEAMLSVEANPKPRAPVASEVGGCDDPQGHSWRIASANQSTRSYWCAVCDVRVKEGKNGGFWASAASKDCGAQPSAGQRSGAHMGCDHTPPEDGSCSTRGQVSEAAVSCPVTLGQDHDEARDLSPDGRGCAALAAGRFPASRGRSQANSLSGLRSLIGLPDVDGRQWRVSPPNVVGDGAGSPTGRTATPGAASNLVSENAKPSCPLDTGRLPPCAKGTHAWKIQHANATARRYGCGCGAVAKERKAGEPARWVAVV